MPGSPQPDEPVSPERPDPAALQERELEAALQLLVERAQYITGATGTALALPQGDEMVCSASAGACAPAVGARLQVRSGLTGESIARRQLLRCDNAETDPRVNLETCRALGIASIVVLPLLRRNGEVRGLFELFSDHPYAFEERDLVALERMAALTLTALDLAEQHQDSVAPAPSAARQSKPAAAAIAPAVAASPLKEISKPQPSPPESGAEARLARPAAEPEAAPYKASPPPEPSSPQPVAAITLPMPPATAEPTSSSAATTVPTISAPILETAPPEPPPVPEAMRRVQKCASCGFPVSEGRTLCLDCESLERMKHEAEKKARDKAAQAGQGEAGKPVTESAQTKATDSTETIQNETDSSAPKDDQAAESYAPVPPDEILPPFLTNPQLTEESWLARHVNLLAFLVLVAAVLVAAVVFFR